MRFSVLFSGSDGNCVYVETENTRLLIDAGKNLKTISSLLASLGRDVSSIDAVCLTHDHSDHISSVPVMEKTFQLPLYASSGTIEAMMYKYSPDGSSWNWASFLSGDSFDIGDIKVTSFPVPHNASDPVGYVFEADGVRLAYVTDLGDLPRSVYKFLSGCTALILEFNFDETMLRNSGRPSKTISRTLGRSGHLSNDEASDALVNLITPGLQFVVPSHISSECNKIEYVKSSAGEAIKGAGIDVQIVLPPYPTPLIELKPRQ